jgi:[NiFe] hydrogenase diaphorase moiety large subunit
MNNPDKIKRTGPVLFSEYEKGSSVRKALEMDRDDILFEIKDSGLKGRGGAGFPVSTKWDAHCSCKCGTEIYSL